MHKSPHYQSLQRSRVGEGYKACLGLSLAVLLAMLPSHILAATAPQAVTQSGMVRGTEVDGVASFKGIPFVAPPVGARRWQPPAAPASWPGVRDAFTFGAACPQMSRIADPHLRTSEDCLTINVWKPLSGASRPKAVMVWIYGGGFIGGASDRPVYDGSKLAQMGVVVVSFNYRVGRLGFFAHPALTASAAAGEPLGNYAFMDQIAALKWIQRNIAAFGGDPRNVTIFGESAGGASVNMLMLSPLARGLFAKAISESGFPRWGGLPLKDAEAIGVEFGAKHGVIGNTPTAAAALRAIPVQDIMQSDPMVDIDRTTPMPIIDGRVLPDNAAKLVGQGAIARMPLLVGGTSCDETVYGGDAAAIFNQAISKRDDFAYIYPGDRTAAILEAESDRIETEPTRFQARANTAAGEATWVYYFDHHAAGTGKLADGCIGAPHGSDVRFVFGNLDASFKVGNIVKQQPTHGTLADSDINTSRAMMGYWVAFAKTGDPNHPGAPHWPAFRANDEETMNFSLSKLGPQRNFKQRKLDWLETKLTGPSVW